MPTLAQTLKAAADAARAARLAAQITATEPRQEILDALQAAADDGQYTRKFPRGGEDPPLVLTQEERNWLTTEGGCIVRPVPNTDGQYIVAFQVPKRALQPES